MGIKLKKDNRADPENCGKEYLETAIGWEVGIIKGSYKQGTSLGLNN